jgi:hypothetical protein
MRSFGRNGVPNLTLRGDLRITDAPRTDHAQYLASWLAVLNVNGGGFDGDSD